MPTGTIKSYNDVRGFGFIAGDFTRDIFLNIKFVANGYIPVVGDRVEFEITTDERTKRPRADNVRPCEKISDPIDEKMEWLREHRGRHADDTRRD